MARDTHAIVLLGTSGTVVHTTRFTPEFSLAEPAEGMPDDGAPQSSFFVVVPGDLTSVTELRLEAAGRVLATRALSASPPTVSVLEVSDGDAEQLDVTWTSSDADQDLLTHSVLVSTDGAASWNLLASDLTKTCLVAPVVASWHRRAGTGGGQRRCAQHVRDVIRCAGQQCTDRGDLPGRRAGGNGCSDLLSEGTHVITATARDSAGGVGSAQVTLRVRRS